MRKNPLEVMRTFLLLDTRYQEKAYVPSSQGLKGTGALVGRFVSFYWEFLTKVSVCFVATDANKKVYGTISVTIDRGSLPIDAIFSNEVSRTREEGKKIVYVGKFASSRDVTCGRTALYMMLEVKKIFLDLQADSCLCVIHPKHLKHYLRFGFKEIAREICMPGLNNAEAVLIVLTRDDIPQMRF